MNTNGIEQLVDHLLARQWLHSDVPIEIIKQIARDQMLIEELAALSTALTGEPSTLQTDIAQLVSEPMDLELLGAYVDAQIAGKDADQLYPAIAQRIQNETEFRTEYETLLALVQAEAQGHFGKAPRGLSFVELQQKDAPSLVAARIATNTIWQEVMVGVNRLLVTIPILVSKSAAVFGELTAPLLPELVPIGVYRSRTTSGAPPEREKYAAVLTLPLQSDLNWVSQVRLGPVEDRRSTVILVVTMLTPSQPIPQVKVILRDANSNLLESIATDEKGLATFSGLEMGAYHFEVEYKGQIEQFSVSLMPQNS